MRTPALEAKQITLASGREIGGWHQEAGRNLDEVNQEEISFCVPQHIRAAISSLMRPEGRVAFGRLRLRCGRASLLSYRFAT